MLTRRSLLKGAGAAIGLVATSFFPRMIHSATGVSHPAWDSLLNHIGHSFGDRRTDLIRWIHDLVFRPDAPQATLLLTGDSSKEMFPKAMELLLPEKVVHFPEDVPITRIQYDLRRGMLTRVKQFPPTEARQQKWLQSLERAWLMVLNDSPEVTYRLFDRPRQRDGRYIKWCILRTNDIGWPNGVLNVLHFPVKPGPGGPDFLRRLRDEGDAFRQTLLAMPERTAIVDESGTFDKWPAHGRLDLNPELYTQNKYRLFAELYGGKRKTISRSHHV